MLNGIDRIVVAVNDLEQAIGNYEYLLDAELVRRWKSPYMAAEVAEMKIGGSAVELCVPEGGGLVADKLQSREGLAAGGICVKSLQGYAEHLQSVGVEFTQAEDRIYISGAQLHGLPLVITEGEKAIDASPGALVTHLYELTVVLDTKWETVAQNYSEKLGIDRQHEVPITFERFGYTGTLMKFHPDQLDRIELSEAHDESFAMGRFSKRHGDGLYMCYVETNNLGEIIRRLEARNGKWTRRTTEPVERDGLWVHPSMLHGVLLGISRDTLAWGWSGNPGRILPRQ
ncbi:VOC family protein [Melaminivora sp.]|uniref:VOC family protein n=1 Tax=Melaminivora sp. TaxID=1933032 RepID=UPI0028AA2EB9|nr:VOC family protein [Melaminivora sp.]